MTSLLVDICGVGVGPTHDFTQIYAAATASVNWPLHRPANSATD